MLIRPWLTVMGVLAGFIAGWYANDYFAPDVGAHDAHTVEVVSLGQGVTSSVSELEAVTHPTPTTARDDVALPTTPAITDSSLVRPGPSATDKRYVTAESEIQPLTDAERYQIQDFIADSNAGGLSTYLGNRDASVRAEVIEGLGLIGDEASVRYLGQVLFSEQVIANRLQAVELLERLSHYSQATHFLAAAKESDPDQAVRQAAAVALGEL